MGDRDTYNGHKLEQNQYLITPQIKLTNLGLGNFDCSSHRFALGGNATCTLTTILQLTGSLEDETLDFLIGLSKNNGATHIPIGLSEILERDVVKEHKLSCSWQ